MKEKLIYLKDKIKPIVLENKKNIIICAGVLLIIIIALVLIFRNGSENFNGNLNNLGFTLKKGSSIFFQGYKEGSVDGIYKMTGSKIEKINDDYEIYLNSSGKYIYYLNVDNYNIMRMKTDGTDKETVIEDVDPQKFVIENDWIYYFDDGNFYKIKTNGKDKKILSQKSIESYEIVGNWIYYSYKNEGKYILAKMKTDGSDITKIDEDAAKNFFVNDNKIYYFKENFDFDNYNFAYEMYSIKTNGKDKEKITELSEEVDVDTINFAKKYVYFVKSSDGDTVEIYRIKLNGKEETKITDVNGYTTNINIFDDWIYYPGLNDSGDTVMYRIRTNGKDMQSLEIK